MIHIPNTEHDPARNLAAEEYILTESGLGEPVLFFYINAPSVIIGRHQNTPDEINADFIREHGIQVVRRCSGGGAVYHDYGNLNYSLIQPGDRKASADFSVLLVPILKALRSLGLDAVLNGRNDLTLNGAKFSGNAYYHSRFGSVTHGTILYDADLKILSEVLRPHPEKIHSKGVASVRSRVCCVKDFLPGIPDINELEEAIVRKFAAETKLEIRHFSDIDLEKIETLAKNRYRSDLWTYGESPAYNIRRLFHLPCGWVDLRGEVYEGKIRSVRFFGDYFCNKEISDLENKLSGTDWNAAALENALRQNHPEDYFPGLSADELVRIIFSASADA